MLPGLAAVNQPIQSDSDSTSLRPPHTCFSCGDGMTLIVNPVRAARLSPWHSLYQFFPHLHSLPSVSARYNPSYVIGLTR